MIRTSWEQARGLAGDDQLRPAAGIGGRRDRKVVGLRRRQGQVDRSDRCRVVGICLPRAIDVEIDVADVLLRAVGLRQRISGPGVMSDERLSENAEP